MADQTPIQPCRAQHNIWHDILKILLAAALSGCVSLGGVAQARTLAQALREVTESCFEGRSYDYIDLINKEVCAAMGHAMVAADFTPAAADLYFRYGQEANELGYKYQSLLALSQSPEQREAIYHLFEVDLANAQKALDQGVARRARRF
jgi:hypothetical protein